MIKIFITRFALFTLVALSFMSVSYAETEESKVVFVDGREVILNNDGSWKYLSTDRYVNTKDGNRVRLKDDGTWQAIGNAPLTTKQQVRTSELDIKLQKVIIETYKKKKQKNTSIQTQTVFYVQLNYSRKAKADNSVKDNDISLIEVKDNNGKSYPVLSLKPDSRQLQPNTNITLIIRAEKSPAVWDDVKSMQIIFKTGIFGIESPITLSQNMIDIGEEKVEGFDKSK